MTKLCSLKITSMKSCYVYIFSILTFASFGTCSNDETPNIRNDTLSTRIAIDESLPTRQISDSNLSLLTSQNTIMPEPHLSPYGGLENKMRTSYFRRYMPSPNGNAVIVSSCQAFKKEFSEAAANFTECAVHYARPIQLCELCHPVYQQAIAIYNIMMKGNVTDEDGVPCGEEILNADRVQIVVTTAMFIEEMWSNSSCDNCFSEENGTVVYQLNNITVDFKALAKRTLDCFKNSSKGRFSPYHTPSLLNTTVCEDCRTIYHQLNALYKVLGKVYPKCVCMDLVDSMNTTRLIWSRDFRCSRIHGNVTGVMVLSFFFCTLPFAFYIGHRVWGPTVQKKLLKQKRLKNVGSMPDVTTPDEEDSTPDSNLLNDEDDTS